MTASRISYLLADVYNGNIPATRVKQNEGPGRLALAWDPSRLNLEINLVMLKYKVYINLGMLKYV